MNDSLIKAQIQKHEGLRLSAYDDTEDKLTIGWGFNLKAGNAPLLCVKAGLDFDAVCAGEAITVEQAVTIFQMQYSSVTGQARITFPEIDSYPDNASAVICDMLFELGWTGFLKFKNTIAAFKALNWAGAIAGIKDSLLVTEVPNRVADNIALLEAIDAN